MDLLLIIDENKSHYVYIKDFDRFMFHKTKNKNKKYFCKSCLQCFSCKNVLTKHKEVCLSINGAQSVRLEKGTIEFKNYFKQILVPFKFYADFECILKSVESYEGFCSKKYQDHVFCSFAYKLACVDDRFSKLIVVYRGENADYKFIEASFTEYKYCKKVMKKHFNKNLIITAEEDKQFQSSNTYWICEKLIEDDDEKVRDHCHITGKFRGAAHWSCNINLQLTKKVPVIFHNLRGYDSHLIFNELNKFDVKIEVIPNRLEKYMTFFLNKNLVFIDSMQFMNFSLEKLARNLANNDLKYLIEEFGFKNLELLKQKDVYHYEYMESLKRFSEKDYLMKNVFAAL